MGYRTAPEPSPEEVELKKLADKGRTVRSGQAAEARSAAMALALRQKEALAEEDKTRLRALGRKRDPGRAPLLIAISVLGITALGGYLLSQTGLHAAVWINLAFWTVLLPSFLPGFFLERRLALRAGALYEAEETHWVNTQNFEIVGMPWDQHQWETKIKVEVHFQGNRPDGELLANALRAVSADVLVEIVPVQSSVGELLEVFEAQSPETLESLNEASARAILSKHTEGLSKARPELIVQVQHRRDHHYAKEWFEDWIHQAIDTAFQTIHKAHKIHSLVVSS